MKRMIREMPNTSRAAVFTAPNLPLLIQNSLCVPFALGKSWCV